MVESADTLAARCARITAGLPPGGLFDVAETHGSPARISPEPFPLSRELADELASQGKLWLRFYKASHALYARSAKGEAPAFIAEYLDAGKPRRILDYGRMNRFKNQYPVIIRPDLILTDDGFAACELDSVPGGFGLTGCLMRLYEGEGLPCLGSPDGIVAGFAAALKHLAGRNDPSVAICVSEESRMYVPEMKWLAGALAGSGLPCRAIRPEELQVAADGVRVGDDPRPIDVVYRFFELFDLDAVPNASALFEAAKMKRVRITPPPKAHLEEKLLFALLHHPGLARLWEAELGSADFGRLKRIVIPGWVFDPRPVPPHAAIAGFTLGGNAVRDWSELAGLSQKERAFVIKPSGFSESSWGSHGVRFGPDMPGPVWAAAVREALAAFPARPHILQNLVRPGIVRHSFYDSATGTAREMEGRARICPYYFVTGEDTVSFGGALATVCPPDKKAIHGMPDAIMVPCAADNKPKP